MPVTGAFIKKLVGAEKHRVDATIAHLVKISFTFISKSVPVGRTFVLPQSIMETWEYFGVIRPKYRAVFKKHILSGNGLKWLNVFRI